MNLASERIIFLPDNDNKRGCQSNRKQIDKHGIPPSKDALTTVSGTQSNHRETL